MNSPTPPPSDPTLAVAERQLAMLGELAEIGMAAARAFGSAALATAKAEEGVVSEDWFVPEVGRARACGARDAAESLRKVSRAVRLTLVLEMNLAEIVRDIRAGTITYIGGIAHRKGVGGASAGQGGYRRADRDADTRSRDRDSESFAEYDRPDVVSRAKVRDIVEQIRDNIGVPDHPHDRSAMTHTPRDRTDGLLDIGASTRACSASVIPSAFRSKRPQPSDSS